MGYKELFRRQGMLLGIALFAVFSGNLGQSFFIGLFQAPIAERLGLSLGEFGTAYSLLSLCAGVIMLYVGPRLDWVAPRRYALGIVGGVLLGALLLTLSPWVSLALLGLGLVRLCGQGLLLHFGMTLAGREFPDFRGRALGVVSLGVPLGEVVLAPLVAVLLVWFGWRELWWALTALLTVVWLWLFTRTARWPSAPVRADASSKSPRGPRPLREARFWRLLPLLLLLPVTMTGIFLYQAQMTRDLDAAIATYALALTGRGLIRFPGALLGGRWVDRLGARLLARLYLLPFALGLLAVVTLGGDVAVWALMLGSGLTVGLQEPVVNALLVTLWGSEHLGRVRATLSAAMVFATGLTPAVFGLLLQAGATFPALMGAILACLALAWLLAQRDISRLDTP
ncbi:hypothetical protein GCM10027040_19920 [Halomonas shantousis]